VIRKAKSEDIPTVMEIETASFTHPWEKSLFIDTLSADGKYFFVYEADNKPVAYIILETVLDEGHITDLAVEANYRNKGIGKQLIEKVLSLSKELKIHSIFLEVRESNEAAKKLYQKLGFKLLGTRKGYYTKNEDALTYICRI
jgi:[ribosomal protein S18]-alanine N-acetyltransferase